MALAIKVENVSKKYRLGTINRDMLYKDIQSWWAKMRGKPDPNAKISFIHQDRLEKGDEFWALRNINLEIEEGEIVGIIGRNGAGKSTLLKILSQITAPTEGKIHVNGRMASLLEVGTGFHPELTGRENVYLNGAILGMSRKEVSKKFDEIVAFSEVEEFIDTPVKRYSSGMYVRLAFSVAAHLEPEILIVDEVLAVGDAAFQDKCIGKMGEVNQKGRTIIFVSHNMSILNAMCHKGVVLSDGEIYDKKNIIYESIEKYSKLITSNSIVGLDKKNNRSGIRDIEIKKITINDQFGNSQEYITSGEKMSIEIEYECKTDKIYNNIALYIAVYNSQSLMLTMMGNELSSHLFSTSKKHGKIICKINRNPFIEGKYLINVQLKQGPLIQDWIKSAAIFNVTNGNFFGNNKTLPKGVSGMLIDHSFEIIY
jgi:lipopolysaccharide transport system ATP-binding protein